MEGEAEAGRRASASRRGWLGALVLVAALFVVYAPALRGGLVWDDDQHLMSPAVRAADGLARIWLDPRANQQYYPLTHTTFWLETRLHGATPWALHVVNVLLHAVSALLVFRLARLLSLPARAAVVAAAVFALHPMQVESVAWITERKNLLSVLLALCSSLALLARLLGERDEAERPPYRILLSWHLAVALLAFALALAAKTAVAPLPVAILLATAWRRPARLREAGWATAPLFVLGLAAGAVTAWLERRHVGAVGASFSLTPVEHLLLAARAFVFYPAKAAVPVGLAFIYPRFELAAPASWLAVVAAALAIVGPFAVRARGAAVAVLAYGALIFPALGFFNVYFFRFSFAQDHFSYPAFVVLALAAGAIADALTRRFTRPRVAFALAALLAVAMGARSAAHAARFSSYEALFEAAIRESPTAWMPLYNLARHYHTKGRVAAAEGLYRRALELEPHDAATLMNLGGIVFETGREGEGLDLLARAAAAAPADVAVWQNRAVALHRAKDHRGADAAYRRALELDPDAPRVLRRFGWLKATSPDDAVRDGAIALGLVERACKKTRAQLARCTFAYAAALAATGRGADAASEARRAAEVARREGDVGGAARYDAQAEAFARGEGLRTWTPQPE